VLVAAVLLVDFFYVVRGVGMTDSLGRYELRAPGPGRYKVRADARGYRTVYSGEYIVEAGDTVEVDLLVSYDPGGSGASDTEGRRLAPGRVPPPAQSADAIPETCDRGWVVEVANRFDQTVKVYRRTEGDPLLLGDVLAGQIRAFRPEGSARPVISVGPHEDWHPRGFRDRSHGLIDVRVYCER
jgi:hypothetical protein